METNNLILSVLDKQQNFTHINDEFSVMELATTTNTELKFNTPISGTIKKALEQDIYTFTGSVGQVLYYDPLKQNFFDDIYVSLIDPIGEITFWEIKDDRYPFNLDADMEPLLLLELTKSGTYQLIFQSNSPDTFVPGNYSFQLLNLDSATPIYIGQTVNGTLLPEEDNLYTFTGTAGQELVFDSLTTDLSSGAKWRLYDPNNDLITVLTGSDTSGFEFVGADFEITLPLDGTYKLILDGDGTSNTLEYSFQIKPFTITPITFYTEVSGTISPGEKDIYRFTGQAGQLLYYDALDYFDALSFPVQFISPSGNEFYARDQFSIPSNSDLLFWTVLPETGTYQLSIGRNRQQYLGEPLEIPVNPSSYPTGAYKFRLLNTDATVIQFNERIDGKISPGQTNVYTITTTTPQLLVFDSLMPAEFASVSWRLNNPDPFGADFFEGNISSDFEVGLLYPGNYILEVSGSPPDTDVDYSFQLITATTTNLNFNTPVLGTIDKPHQRDIYTFTGSVGHRLYYDALKNDLFDSINITLLTPLGQIWFAGDPDKDSILPPLPENGTYTLIITGNQDDSLTFEPDNYEFQLLDTATSTVSFDTSISGTLLPGVETDVYSFIGRAGQNLIFDSLIDGTSSASWTLYADDPFIPVAFGGNISSDFRVTLPVDETYVLVIDGSSASAIDYNFQIIDVSARQVIDGTSSRDTLTGTSANEIITGFQGADVLTGGFGKDIFRYTSNIDGGDRITDFTVGIDKIDLTGVLYNLGYTGTDAIADGYVQFGARGQLSSLVKIDPDGFNGSAKNRTFIVVNGVDVASLSSSENFLFFSSPF